MEHRSRRGTIAGELRFLLDALVLAVAVAADLIYNWVACAGFILFFRKSRRRRMAALILGSPGRGVLAVAVAAGFACLAGCGGREPTTKAGDSWTLSGQIRQVQWSTEAIINQSDAPKSLEDDLQALGPDPKWKEHLRFDLESLFLMEDSRKSLEQDLETFGAPENHGLKETFELWGW